MSELNPGVAPLAIGKAAKRIAENSYICSSMYSKLWRAEQIAAILEEELPGVAPLETTAPKWCDCYKHRLERGAFPFTWPIPCIFEAGTTAQTATPSPTRTDEQISAREWFFNNRNQFVVGGEFRVTRDRQLLLLDERGDAIPIPAWAIENMLAVYAKYQRGPNGVAMTENKELAGTATPVETAAQLTHTRSCPALTPGNDERCTCGLQWRIALQTEQTMHAAWRKRAEEAELDLTQVQKELRELRDWKESAMVQLAKSDRLRELLPDRYWGWDVYDATVAEIKALQALRKEAI